MKDAAAIWRTQQQLVLMDEAEWLLYEKHINEIEPIAAVRNASMHKSTIQKGIADGIKFDSKYEFIVYKYMRDIKGYVVERNKTDSLPYIDPNGRMRRFFYDFKLSNGDKLEIKGRFRDTDYCKREQHPEVIWYTSAEIMPMQKELRDKFGDSWDVDFMRTN
jgi:hypothetical protein